MEKTINRDKRDTIIIIIILMMGWAYTAMQLISARHELRETTAELDNAIRIYSIDVESIQN